MLLKIIFYPFKAYSKSKVNMYKAIFLCSAFIIGNNSYADSSSKIWLSIDAGKGLSNELGNEKNEGNNFLGAKIFMEFSKNSYLMDLGLGLGEYKMKTKYESGILSARDFKSTFPVIYLSPKYKLNKNWILGMNFNYLYKGIKTAVDHEENLFIGPSLSYSLNMNKNIESRIVVSGLQGMALGSRPMQLAMVSLQLGYKVTKEEKISNSIEKTEEVKADNSLFEFDRFSLIDGDKKKLEKVASILKQTGFARILIEGHTDRIGNQHYNLKLSKKRADKVKEFLVSLGLDGNKMIVIPRGEQNLLDKGFSKEAHEKNRRVELQILILEKDLKMFDGIN